MKKVFFYAACAAVTVLASCKCGESKPADGAVCDSASVETVADSAATVADSAAANDSTAKREINANDIFAHRMERLTKELILDDAQQAKLAEILTVGADRIEKYIDANERPSLEEVKKFHAEEAEKVKAILNADQFEKFQKMEEETAKRFAERVAAKAAKAAAEAAK